MFQRWNQTGEVSVSDHMSQESHAAHSFGTRSDSVLSPLILYLAVSSTLGNVYCMEAIRMWTLLKGTFCGWISFYNVSFGRNHHPFCLMSQPRIGCFRNKPEASSPQIRDMKRATDRCNKARHNRCTRSVNTQESITPKFSTTGKKISIGSPYTV